MFFPLEERIAGPWLWLAEALPLLHPVRLARAAITGTTSAILVWDVAYIAIGSTALLLYARRAVRQRLTT